MFSLLMVSLKKGFIGPEYGVRFNLNARLNHEMHTQNYFIRVPLLLLICLRNRAGPGLVVISCCS